MSGEMAGLGVAAGGAALWALWAAGFNLWRVFFPTDRNGGWTAAIACAGFLLFAGVAGGFADAFFTSR